MAAAVCLNFYLFRVLNWPLISAFLSAGERHLPVTAMMVLPGHKRATASQYWKNMGILCQRLATAFLMPTQETQLLPLFLTVIQWMKKRENTHIAYK